MRQHKSLVNDAVQNDNPVTTPTTADGTESHSVHRDPDAGSGGSPSVLDHHGQTEKAVHGAVAPSLTPLKAIHAKCVDCNSDPGINSRLWATCDFDGVQQELCPLWVYRTGHDPYKQIACRKRAILSGITASAASGGIKAPAIPAYVLNAAGRVPDKPRNGYLGAIRAYCLWCCADQLNEVRLCPSVKCALWPYRFGRKPKVSAGVASAWGKENPVEDGALEVG